MRESGERLKEIHARIGLLSKASAELFSGFARVSRTASAPGTMTAAQKELVAAAIAVSQGCDDCILYHVEAALKQGAQEGELIEVINVAIEMGGGPAVMYGAKALQVFKALQEDR